jgi:hypothetical protein
LGLHHVAVGLLDRLHQDHLQIVVAERTPEKAPAERAAA